LYHCELTYATKNVVQTSEVSYFQPNNSYCVTAYGESNGHVTDDVT